MSELRVNRIQSQSGLPIELPTGIGYTPAGAGAVATTVQSKLREFVSVKDFGAVGDGVTDDTAAFANALAAAEAVSGELVITAGRFRGNFTFNGKVKVRGAGRKSTVLVARDTALPIVTVYGDPLGGSLMGGDFFADISDFSIDGETTASVGLQLGDRHRFGFNYGKVSNVYIERCATFGISLLAAVGCDLSGVYSYANAGIALSIPTAASVQAVTFTGCAFRLSGTGAWLRSGNRLTFINTVFESNFGTGLHITREGTSGPASSDFINCWFENNGTTGTPGNPLSSSILLDMLAAEQATNWHNLKFTACMVASHANAFDVYATRAIGVIFDRCTFSPTAQGGFTPAKFNFTHTGRVTVVLNQCGSLNLRPSPALYAAMPALITAAGVQASDSTYGTQGFEYHFEWLGRTYSNWNPYGVAGGVIGTRTPASAGEEIFDSTSGVWYKATGSTTFDWRPISSLSGVNTAPALDSNRTLTAGTSPATLHATVPMTGTATLTLSTTGAWNGAEFRIVRATSATGAFSLNVGDGPLKALAPGQWCRVLYNGTAWVLAEFGAL